MLYLHIYLKKDLNKRNGANFIQKVKNLKEIKLIRGNTIYNGQSFNGLLIGNFKEKEEITVVIQEEDLENFKKIINEYGEVK
jgi:hypothetical protein